MANELTINMRMDLAMAGSTDKLVAAEGLSRTVAATGVIHRAYTIPEAETALDMSGITTAGYFVAVNVSGTGLISIAAASGETAEIGRGGQSAGSGRCGTTLRM